MKKPNINELKAAFQKIENGGKLITSYKEDYLIEVENDDEDKANELYLGDYSTGAVFCEFTKTDFKGMIVRGGDHWSPNGLERYIETEGNRWVLRQFNYNGDVVAEEEIEPLCIDEEGYVYFRSK